MAQLADGLGMSQARQQLLRRNGRKRLSAQAAQHAREHCRRRTLERATLRYEALVHGAHRRIWQRLQRGPDMLERIRQSSDRRGTAGGASRRLPQLLPDDLWALVNIPDGCRGRYRMPAVAQLRLQQAPQGNGVRHGIADNGLRALAQKRAQNPGHKISSSKIDGRLDARLQKHVAQLTQRLPAEHAQPRHPRQASGKPMADLADGLDPIDSHQLLNGVLGEGELHLLQQTPPHVLEFVCLPAGRGVGVGQEVLVHHLHRRRGQRIHRHEQVTTAR
mmetsp:Transcript_96469/g.269983  ORF Transcript_96469/g.269983 Transcript_96469/m.269983 type:complete len:276 (-) Transcript_96469:187-1014(-)